MRNTIKRFAVAGAAFAAAGALALAGGGAQAFAAGTVNGPFDNIGEAGYQIQSAVPFNEVRTTVHIPAGSSTSPFIALAETVNGGRTVAIGLVNIGGQYFLEGLLDFQFVAQTGVPLPVAIIQPQLVPLPTLGVPAGHPLFSSATGGSYYIEIHYSTSKHLVQFVAGPTETDAATLNSAFAFSFTNTFNAPAIETLNFGGGFLPVNVPQASFTRSGITEPAGHNVGGIAGTRITFDFFALDEARATEFGGPASIGNLVTLKPQPALPGVGSAFGIITGP
jgi:hypothetical protein